MSRLTVCYSVLHCITRYYPEIGSDTAGGPSISAKDGKPLALPFRQIHRHRNGHCTRKRKNWSNGQSNFASHCAMLRMENIQMRSALTSVGGSPPRQKYGGQRGAGLQSSGSAVCAPRSTLRGSGTRAISGFEHLLPFALVYPRNALQPPWLVTNHSSLVTAFLIGNKVTIEIVPTHRKQRRATNSNR